MVYQEYPQLGANTLNSRKYDVFRASFSLLVSPSHLVLLPARTSPPQTRSGVFSARRGGDGRLNSALPSTLRRTGGNTFRVSLNTLLIEFSSLYRVPVRTARSVECCQPHGVT